MLWQLRPDGRSSTLVPLSSSTDMRDADEDEDTRILVTPANVSSPVVGRARQPGLPPPLTGLSEPNLEPDLEDEATRLMKVGQKPRGRTWLVSEGANAPRELSQEQLTSELESGRVTAKAFAWQKGMKEWQSVTQLPALARWLKKPMTRTASPPLKRPPKSSPHVARKCEPGDEVGARPTPEQPSASAVSGSSTDAECAESDTTATAPNNNVAEPASRPASAQPNGSGAPKPQRGEAKGASAEPRSGAAQSPRPAAGRPPAPDEPVAKGASLGHTPAVVVATGLSQGMLEPKISSHRETTQPARARLSPSQLRAAGGQPNLFLWALGAGGWVIAGVLAGVLVARDPEPAAQGPAPLRAAPLARERSLAPPPIEQEQTRPADETESKQPPAQQSAVDRELDPAGSSRAPKRAGALNGARARSSLPASRKPPLDPSTAALRLAEQPETNSSVPSSPPAATGSADVLNSPGF